MTLISEVPINYVETLHTFALKKKHTSKFKSGSQFIGDTKGVVCVFSFASNEANFCWEYIFSALFAISQASTLMTQWDLNRYIAGTGTSFLQRTKL